MTDFTMKTDADGVAVDYTLAGDRIETAASGRLTVTYTHGLESLPDELASWDIHWDENMAGKDRQAQVTLLARRLRRHIPTCKARKGVRAE